MNKYSRICAEISLDAIDSNLKLMDSRLTPGVGIIAVIKANGYGHGAVPIAQHIESNPVIWGFACATASEALQLREAGIIKPILLLGYVFPESYEALIQAGIRFCIFDEASARQLSECAAMLGRNAIVHYAVDTGMSRIGFSDNEEGIRLAAEISGYPNLIIEGLFTHFARADETSVVPATTQFLRYLEFDGALRSRGVNIPVRHVCNSAGLMRMPEADLDLVRAGITLYGLLPSGEIKDEVEGLSPVMKLTSHVVYVKTLPAGAQISYGGTYVTNKETRVATLPVGYADGYPRSLSNKGFVLLHGKKAPILGRVCMDQMMVDVTEIPGVQTGDEAVLIGSQGDENITADELGNLSGRFNYELVSDISQRVPRRFTLSGRIVHEVDYLI